MSADKAADGRGVQRAGRPLEPDAIARALAGQYGTTIGAARLERRAHLDTFDRRLARAGMHLVHRRAATGGRLELTRPGRPVVGTAVGPGVGPVVAAEAAADLSWPAGAGVLPPGTLRELVDPVAGIRALIALSDERRRLRRLDVRNADGKAVVRLELDEPAAPSGGPAFLTLRTVLGYDDDARRAGRLLRAAGLEWIDESHAAVPPDPAVPATPAGPADPSGPTNLSGPANLSGPTSPVAPAKSAAPADAAEPARAALARALARFLDAMAENVPGLIDDVDTEFLHDFRVALRRTRATLKLGRAALPPELLAHWEPEFRWLGVVTTSVRDLDVYQLDLPVMASWLVAADAEDLAPFAAHLGGKRDAERRELVRALRSARFKRLVTGWAEELGRLSEPGPKPGPPRDPAGTEMSVGDLAADALARAYRRVLRGGAAIAPDTAATELHTLRGRCKELRYALEVFAPVLDPAARKRAVADLTALQDVLGRFQDSQVQREALEVFAGEMMAAGTPVAALLAMGELIGHLNAEQQLARASFAAEFARFARRAENRQPHVLGGTR